MSDALKLDKDLKEVYVLTCSDALGKILRDRGLVQPLSRTIIIGRIWYDLREEVRDHLSEIISKVQDDIPDEESKVTGILVIYLSFFYLVVEGSDEALKDILHGVADTVREGVVLKAKVVRTGGIVDRFFNRCHTCVINTPRYEEDEFLEDQSPVRKKSAFFDDIHTSPTTRRKSLFINESVGKRMSIESDFLPSRPSSADGDLGRRSSNFTNTSIRRKSRFIDDTDLDVRHKSSSSQISKLSLRRKSSLAQGSKLSLRHKSSLAQGSKLSLRRKSSLAQGSKMNLGLKSSLAQDSELNVRRKSRFADIVINFMEEENDDDDVSLIARMLFKLEEVMFVLASCIRSVRQEEVEARLNELLPSGVLLNGEELSDLWREDFFLSVEEHIDRYFSPLSHTSFLEEEWPPTGPAHDPNDFLVEIFRFEKLVDLAIEEEWRKKPH